MQDRKKCVIFAIEIKTYYKMNDTIYILQRERTEYEGNKVADCYETIEPLYFASEAEAEMGIVKFQKYWQNNLTRVSTGHHSVAFGDVILRWRIIPLYHA